MLADYLVDAVFPQSEPPRQGKTTALVTFNVRGVGRSGGSLGWVGLDNRTNEADFAKVEQWAFEAFSQSGHNIKDVYRVVSTSSSGVILIIRSDVHSLRGTPGERSVRSEHQCRTSE